MRNMVFAKLVFFPPKFFLLRKISLFQNTKKKKKKFYIAGGSAANINLRVTLVDRPAWLESGWSIHQSYPKKKKGFGGKKINLAKKVGPIYKL